MAPKRKSVPSQNPFHSEASSSSNPTPHVRFCDDKTRWNFSEKFSRRGIHSECQVILSDFSDTDLPTVIHSRGWESLCDIPANLGGFVESHSSSPEASEEKDNDGDSGSDDDATTDEDTSSFDDDEMTAFQ
ncbi:hypothetical protein SO802_005721 [Lithocarpus litseifolius]|uniref:Uncharacterized protein n=1 Tax=Lithocarpus litseifolius TaxID=425828 RepID=A0AAW2DLZ9_9ROSI